MLNTENFADNPSLIGSGSASQIGGDDFDDEWTDEEEADVGLDSFWFPWPAAIPLQPLAAHHTFYPSLLYSFVAPLRKSSSPRAHHNPQLSSIYCIGLPLFH